MPDIAPFAISLTSEIVFSELSLISAIFFLIDSSVILFTLFATFSNDSLNELSKDSKSEIISFISSSIKVLDFSFAFITSIFVFSILLIIPSFKPSIALFIVLSISFLFF